MRLNRLDLNLLVVLETVLTERSVRRTSERLNMSQPAVSGALKRLRDHFSDDLLVMKGRSLHPTEFGLKLLPTIRESLTRLREISTASPSFDPHTSDRCFTIVASEALSVLLTNQIARRFRECGFAVSLRWQSNSNGAFDRFSHGEADLLLLRAGFEFPSRPLFTETFSCIVWSENSTVGSVLGAEEFCELEHVLINVADSESTLSIADQRLRDLGIVRRSQVTVGSYGLAPTTVIGTDLIATIPTRLARLLCKWMPLQILPLPFEIGTFMQHIYWHPFASDDLGLQWLIGEIVSAAREDHPVGSGRPTGAMTAA